MNAKQKALAEYVRRHAGYWMNSNDIDSPSVANDAESNLRDIPELMGLSEWEYEPIEQAMFNLITAIRKLK